ncbi:MAG: glycosyltransferase family 4 protein [Elusimicrobiota bacterium]|jgi:glycosyltransferase involved in cell wall biosynthesis
MKILQLIDVPWDSGLAHYALVLAEGLKKNGHQVFVSAVPGGKPWMKARRLGLRTVPLATLKGLNPLRHFLKEHKIDLVNAHTGSTHSLAVASALGQGVAVVRTRADARGVQKRVGSWFLYKHTQRVITAAEYIRQAYVKALQIAPKKIVTVYQGVSLPDFEGTPLPEETVLGIVARLDPVKGHRYLLEALHLLKDIYPKVRLRIIGQEENIKQRELRGMAERLRMENRVSFEGFQTQVPRVMAGCSIGVIASTGSEAVSRAAVEWMAAGRPVVATRVGCLPEIVKDGETGFLADPKDAPSLARALAVMLHDPTRTAAMGKAARQRAEKLFGIPRFVEETLSVYKDALAEIRRS